MLSKEMRASARDVGLLIFRVCVGGLMIVGHGYPKWASYGEKAGGFADPFGLGAEMSLALAVSAEFFCAMLVVVGLATRLAALPLVITMATAAFIAHAGDPFADKEMALLYGTCFLTLVLTGPGRLSLDALIDFWRRD